MSVFGSTHPSDKPTHGSRFTTVTSELQRRAMTKPPIRISITPSDMLMFVAAAMLPFDGTKVGISLPYWTPISPWLFALYSIANWRYLRDTARRYLPFFLFPLLLVITSIYGWQSFGIHAGAAAKSFISILLGLTCLISLDIAIRIKGIPLRTLLTTLFAAYVMAFFTGILQYAALEQHLGWRSIRVYFWDILYRYYVGIRPQFMFAEPSYIGMHLFGILLPVFLLTHDRRIGITVAVFAVGAIIMGSGTRIVLDTVIAVLLWLVATVNFRSRKATTCFTIASGLITASGIGALFLDPRLNSLVTNGLLAGDGSMSARIFHMLAPMWSWKHDRTHLMFGWGAGNISNAVRTGYSGARRWYDAHGGISNAEIDGLANPPTDTFTMSIYASFITEFGLFCFLSFLLLIVVFITLHHNWSRKTICWLILLAYLYIQFEAYAFYAIPLFIWTVGIMPGSNTCTIFRK